ncbi:uncharacterized protein AC631_05831 [Debaryomyces fabryi]|uniref:AMMECR1 domain-containing protein n=1 Tax=Debaryomyces fabryi TaxID=58627 RepID=A0A0V1PQF8_9ASCO|nr:uncharacterized protein AC631_05831 [Debaryomyces fabryi]KRZ98410.1 hypothetical protein AC631_05831 [Debaryomyces fabryi]CUM48051.1 unnamed protein product [Debaryomyces fabryi]
MSKSLCCLAFETLHSKLFTDSVSISYDKFKSVVPSAVELPLKAPLFITWNKNEQLRGCIGTFQPLKVESGTKRFSLTSSLQDPRFPPIGKLEFHLLSVSVTLLDNFEPIKDWDDWTVGDHGLKVNFHKNGEIYLGTFLPSVAVEQEWDKITTLTYLLKKADYTGVSKSKTAEFYQTGIEEGWLELVRYEGLKECLGYNEFMELRNSIK